VVFSLSYAGSCVGAYFRPAPTRAFLVKLTSAPYFVGWCCLIGAIYVSEAALGLVMLGGAFLGLGSAGFYMLWQRLFASQDSDAGNRDLLVGTAWGALLYFALYLIPQAITAYLIPLVFLPLFGLCVTLKSRTINRAQPMFEDVPREHPQVYLQVLRDYWRSALCVGAVGFCAGIMRSVAVAEPSLGIYVNALSMAGMLAAALIVIWLWRLKGQRLSGLVDAAKAVAENCAMRVPTVFFLCADNQQYDSEFFGREERMLFAGDIRKDREDCLERVLAGLKTLMEDRALRERMEEALGRVTDGCGAERISIQFKHFRLFEL